jgi:hypothetical protein
MADRYKILSHVRVRPLPPLSALETACYEVLGSMRVIVNAEMAVWRPRDAPATNSGLSTLNAAIAGAQHAFQKNADPALRSADVRVRLGMLLEMARDERALKRAFRAESGADATRKTGLAAIRTAFTRALLKLHTFHAALEIEAVDAATPVATVETRQCYSCTRARLLPSFASSLPPSSSPSSRSRLRSPRSDV